jgi:hypothetical protein
MNKKETQHLLWINPDLKQPSIRFRLLPDFGQPQIRLLASEKWTIIVRQQSWLGLQSRDRWQGSPVPSLKSQGSQLSSECEKYFRLRKLTFLNFPVNIHGYPILKMTRKILNKNNCNVLSPKTSPLINNSNLSLLLPITSLLQTSPIALWSLSPLQAPKTSSTSQGSKTSRSFTLQLESPLLISTSSHFPFRCNRNPKLKSRWNRQLTATSTGI